MFANLWRSSSSAAAFSALLLVLPIPLASLARGEIPSGPDAPVRRTFLEKFQESELALVEQYAQRTADPAALREPAQRVLRSIRRLELGLDAELSSPEIHKLGMELIGKGAQDPLVVAATLRTLTSLDAKEPANMLCQQAVADVVKRYAPREQVGALVWLFWTQEVLYRKYFRDRMRPSPPDAKVLGDAFIRWMAAESDSLPAQRSIWKKVHAHYLQRDAYRSRALSDVAKASQEVKIHPWMRLMLDGQVASDQAFELLLSEDEGHKLLHQQAWQHYQAAWKLAPQFPEAPGEMIHVARQWKEDGSPRDWFDKTVAAEMDYPLAYEYYRTYLRQIGIEELVQFGAECAATKRYDTEVPYELIESLWAAENQYGQNVWARPGIYEMVRDFCQDASKAPTYMGEPQTNATRSLLAANQIMIAVRANRFDEISPLWDKATQADLQRTARHFAVTTPLDTLKSAADAARGGAAKLVNELEQLLASLQEAADVQAVEQKLQAVAAVLGTDDPRVVQWQAAVAVYRDFFAGRWADVTFPDGSLKLAGARKWTRVDERTVVTRGTCRFPLTMLAGLPPPFELSFDISTVEMPPDVLMAGVQVGKELPAPNYEECGCFMGLNSKSQQAGIRRGWFPARSPAMGETNRCQVRAWYGYFEFLVNGERAASELSDAFTPAGYLALWVPGAEDTTPIVRYSHLRIRQIAYDAPPEFDEVEARIAYYTQRIQEEPEHSEHYADRGEAYRLAGQPAEAIQDFQRALKNREQDVNLIVKLGMAQAASGAYQAAVDCYQKALDIFPRSERAQERWAWLEATCPDPKFRHGARALARMQTVMSTPFGRRPDYSLTVAAAQAEQGQFPAALATLKRVEPQLFDRYKGLAASMRTAFEAGQPYRE